VRIHRPIPTLSKERIIIELWMAINVVCVVDIAAVGFGVVLGRIGLAG
jgi:hypothetical protein